MTTEQSTPPAQTPPETPFEQAKRERLARFGNVHGKLAHVQHSVTAVEKTGQAPEKAGGYRYVQEHKEIELLRPLLREVGATVVVSPADSDTTVLTEGWQIGQRKGQLVTLEGRLTFTCIDTGASITAEFCGQGEDTGDKAAGKAQTYLSKYALQKFFQIPTEGIDDSDSFRDADAGAPSEAVVSGGAPPVAAEGAPRLGEHDAARLIEGLADMVKKGTLDPNKVKAKLATFRTDDVAALTHEQATQLWDWAQAQAGS